MKVNFVSVVCLLFFVGCATVHNETTSSNAKMIAISSADIFDTNGKITEQGRKKIIEWTQRSNQQLPVFINKTTMGDMELAQISKEIIQADTLHRQVFMVDDDSTLEMAHAHKLLPDVQAAVKASQVFPSKYLKGSSCKTKPLPCLQKFCQTNGSNCLQLVP
ncbi:MAG: hypothetical protein J6U05_05820 [Neisseriaceae bacterium]|nr:hypothetical protein [Neisseriaceae bacterium]